MTAGNDSEETEHVTFCRICNAACGLRITTRGERVLRVRGDPAHPISKGYTCPKGRASGAFHHDPRRLDHPLLRRGGALVRASWPDALDDLARELQRIRADHGAGAIAYYLGTAIAFDTGGYWGAQTFFEALETPQRYTCATVDTPCKLLVSELMSGFSFLHPIPDVDECRMLLMLGTNPVVSHGHLTGMTNPVANLRQIARQGEVWVVDPRRTASARGATRHLAIRPGADAFLVAFLLREILEQGADRAYLAEHARGLEALEAAVAPFDLARAVATTGLAESDILELLAALRRHGRFVGLTGTGTTMSAGANVTEWLLWALQIVTGSFERPGGAWFNPGFMTRLDRKTDWLYEDGVAEPGPASRPELPRRRGEYPCAALVDEIEAGHVRALFVPGGNPIAAFPDSERTLEALRRLEVLVVGDVVHNEIVELATHVWPCTGQLERADLSGLMEFYRLAPIAQLARPIVAPVAERRPLWWCFDALAGRLGLSIRPADFEPRLGDAADERLLARISDPDIDLDALATPCIAEDASTGWVERSLLRDGRWELAPAVFVDQLATLDEPPGRALIPGRQLRTMNSALRDIGAERERLDSVQIHLAPRDAEAAGVHEGEPVRVRSENGALEGETRIDPDLREGAIWIPHGWVEPNVGRLTRPDRDLDPLTGMVLQSGVEVRVESIREASAEEPSDSIETCFATIERTATDVWKRRKRLRLRLGDEEIDLRSIDARRAACLEENRLARILAPDVPLGVVPLFADSHGTPRPQGSGAPIDWALHMRRLRDDDRADERLAAGRLADDQLAAVARRIALLHERTKGQIGERPDRALERLRDRIRLRITSPDWSDDLTFPPEAEDIEAWQLEFLEAQSERFARRARNDAIREGHGELALDHVYLDDEGGLQILPGLELGSPLRSADVAADVAQLATDLAARRRTDLAERFVAEYARLANDFDLYPLLDFYASLRATLRAKLDWICAHRLADNARAADRYRERARRFFALALASPRRALLPPVVVAMGGQVASGKSTVAQHIARRIGAPVVGSDPTREYLLGARLDPARHESRWEESYAPGFSTRVYDEVLRRAGEVLDSGRPVVIDGCFRANEQRQRARDLAARFGLPFLFVEARIDRSTQLDRLASRSLRDSVPIEDWTQIADDMRAGWEPTDDLPVDEHLALDTSLPLELNALEIERRLPTWPSSLTG